MMEPEDLKCCKYLPLKNESNLCWLNSSIMIIAHNKTLKKIALVNQDSEIYKIISTYDDAVSTLNGSDGLKAIKATEKKLMNLQINTLCYLQPKLKTKPGEPDSAFCALLNLIYQNQFIKNHLNISWLWERNCINCGKRSKSKVIVKPIITFSKVNDFEPVSPTSLYMCSCKTEQKMKLIYKDLPPCLFFHFENGAGNESELPLNFTIQNRTYHLCGLITLEQSEKTDVKHFVSWIRDPFCNTWLDCNDLNTDIIFFSHEPPEFNPKFAYMYIFESFDSLDKISNQISEDIQSQELEISNEIIDISDEPDDLIYSIKSEDSVSYNEDLEKAKNDIVTNNTIIVEKLFSESPKFDKMMTKTAVKNQEMAEDTSSECEFSKTNKVNNKPLRDLDVDGHKDTAKNNDKKCSSELCCSENHPSESTTIAVKDCGLNSPIISSSKYSFPNSCRDVTLPQAKDTKKIVSFHSISESDYSESTARDHMDCNPVLSCKNKRKCKFSESCRSSKSLNFNDDNDASVSSNQLSGSDLDINSSGILGEDSSSAFSSDSMSLNREAEQARENKEFLKGFVCETVNTTVRAFLEAVFIKKGK